MPHSSSSYRYPRRPAPPLPVAASLPFPGNLVRECSDCDLRASCKAPVPGDGPTPAEVMFVGEAPGRDEDEWGYKPFVGQAGKQLESLLMQAGLPRSLIYITNTIHCRPPNNRDPKPEETKACAKWLRMELEVVQPRIIVALGAPAIRWFLGPDAGTVEHLHAKPIEADGRIILPCYHPASSLYNTELLRSCQEDFQVLRGLVKGDDWRDYLVQDDYPNPEYRVVDTPETMTEMEADILEAGEFAVDTEICGGKLWSIQISARPGTSWFIPVRDDYRGRVDLSKWDAKAIVHYYLFDINYIKLRETNFVDTMVQAYLVGQIQGLKSLASRLCGIDMKDYSEVVRPGQQKLSMRYLTKASKQEWPDPPMIEETKWNNKKGCIITRNMKPWHISRKIARILADTVDNTDVDPLRRWRDIPELERAAVEKKLGPMPESSLADIKFKDAVRYACKDADATLRVHHKLNKLISQYGLEFVQYMDLGILPMVYNMMQTGMPVDVDHFRNLSIDYDARMRAKSAELSSIVGHSFNPNSRPQVAAVVYNELGFTPTRLTPTKEISTDDQELKKTGHPVAKGIIEYRRLSKMKGTYADALAEWARKDSKGVSRVHTTLKTTRVATGRLACVPLSTQMLTQRGWKAWYELIVGESVIGYDIVHNRLAWTILSGVHRGTGKLGGLKVGRRRRPEEMILCTPEHKWVVTLRQYDKGNSRVPDLRGIVEARHLGNGRALSPFLQTTIPLVDGGLPVSSTEAGIIGWAITDGHIISTSSRRRALSIRLRKPQSINAVVQLLANVAHTRHTYNVLDEDFYLGVKVFEPLWSQFVELGLDQYVLGLSVAARIAMFDCMMEADGNRDSRHNRWAKRSGSIAAGVMELLAFLLGKRYTSRYYATKHGTTMREFHFLSEQRYGQNASYRTESGDKHEVWCPETTLGTWVLRQGRYIAITGNSADPNLQNIPTRNKESKAIKSGFVAPPERLLAEGDLAQVELCTQAHLARCKGLIGLFIRGGDPHTETASRIFGVSLDEAKKDKYRYPCKRAGFGIIYLIGPQGLHSQITEYIADLEMDGEPIDIDPWSVEDCEKFINDYYQLYPEIKDYQMEMAAHARRYGYVQDMFGRIRYIPEVSSPIRRIQEAGLRMAANMPVTASAQGILKLAMGELWRELPRTDWHDKAKWLMQIHDSLIVEVVEDDEILKPYLRWMRDVMCGVVKLLVPVRVDFKVGKRWGELEKISLKEEAK